MSLCACVRACACVCVLARVRVSLDALCSMLCLRSIFLVLTTSELQKWSFLDLSHGRKTENGDSTGNDVETVADALKSKGANGLENLL